MNYRNLHPWRDRIYRNIWRVVSYVPFNYLPHYSGIFLRNLILKVFGAKLGKGVVVNNKVKIYSPRNIFLDDNSSVGPGVLLYSVNEIRVGKGTVISQNSELITASHDYTNSHFELKTKPITIGDYCWLAQGTCILPGVTLKDNVVCAAHSVVSKSYDDSCIVIGGNPSVVLKRFIFSKRL